jgi:hypothetical protein
VSTPRSQTSVEPLPTRLSTEVTARIAFHSGRASIASTVSKVCGFSSGPGMLRTLRPASSVSEAGIPVTKAPGSGGRPGGGSFGGSSANASAVSAATPGFKR